MRSDSKISRKPAPSSILPTATTRGREHPQAPRVQAAGEVLGEHGETLLGLVVPGQPDGQQRQGLPGTVLVGDDVGADLVVQQWLDPVRTEGGGLRDQRPTERHHQLGGVLAHLEVWTGSLGSGHLQVSLELLASRLRERASGDALATGTQRPVSREQLLSRPDTRVGETMTDRVRSEPSAKREV